MKTIETKGGMIFEIWTSRKEALHDIDMLDFDMEWWGEDDALYIKYKDGSHFYIGSEIEGKFKRTNIETIIYSNSATTCLYGNYRIYNMDDTAETYSEAVDSEEKFWNADEA